MENQNEVVETLLTPAQLGLRWGRSPGYLANLRATGEGPRFITLSERIVRYKLADVEAFEMGKSRRSIAEKGPPEAA